MHKGLPEFQRLQYEFASHLRNPEVNPAPVGIEARRIALYRDLFYNNIQSFLAGGFPVLRKLYNDVDWHSMVRNFYSMHKSHTPYFMEVSQEFLRYLQEEREPQPEDPACMTELAHYEWVELAVAASENEPDWKTIDVDGDLLEGRPVMSPLVWLLSYSFPVHKISPDFNPQLPGESATHLVVYRNRDDKVKFIEANPVTARLISLIEESPEKTGNELLVTIAHELQHPKPQVVIDGGLQTLKHLYSKDIVLGTRRVPI